MAFQPSLKLSKVAEESFAKYQVKALELDNASLIEEYASCNRGLAHDMADEYDEACFEYISELLSLRAEAADFINRKLE